MTAASVSVDPYSFADGETWTPTVRWQATGLEVHFSPAQARLAAEALIAAAEQAEVNVARLNADPAAGLALTPHQGCA